MPVGDERLLAALCLLEKWGCNDQQIKRLLGIRHPKTLEMFSVGGIPLTDTMVTRIDYLLRIDSVLSKCFNQQLEHLRYEFVNRRNTDPLFKLETPLQCMLRGIKNLEKTAIRLQELYEN